VRLALAEALPPLWVALLGLLAQGLQRCLPWHLLAQRWAQRVLQAQVLAYPLDWPQVHPALAEALLLVALLRRALLLEHRLGRLA
jgi:hypothetical protein